LFEKSDFIDVEYEKLELFFMKKILVFLLMILILDDEFIKNNFFAKNKIFS